MTEFKFDCRFCEEVIETPTASAVKDRGVTHLEDHHQNDMKDVFSVAFGGKGCQNDCGYTFPVGVDEVADYECPECSHDHFPSFVQNYVYWRIEQK